MADIHFPFPKKKSENLAFTAVTNNTSLYTYHVTKMTIANRPFHRKGKYARNVAQRNSACYDVICWSTLAITTTALFLSLEAHFSSLSLFS